MTTPSRYSFGHQDFRTQFGDRNQSTQQSKSIGGSHKPSEDSNWLTSWLGAGGGSSDCPSASDGGSGCSE